MKTFPDKSFDMILTDPPYEKTACKWNNLVSFEELWAQYKRIIKPGRAIVMMGQQPFFSKLITSNLEWFKYELIWEKPNGTSPYKAKYMPMINFENIAVFGNGTLLYNPQMEEGKPYTWNSKRSKGIASNIKQTRETPIVNTGTRYPKGILKFKQERGLHPTQKPVDLGRWLVRTYSNIGDIVLDNFCGSGSFVLAAVLEDRRAIGIDNDSTFVEIAKERISDAC
ncbi:site-specific DNA-methyltransferase [Candidatus Dojkabacteria bacterium]|jgi:DNA modification methylase|nr:site-specific DNA-methyltransferase [Candidatus Dojkabacteria bacterium]